jgi:hypothetical protein
LSVQIGDRQDQHLGLADGRDRQATDLREGVVAKRVDPLLAVLGVLPRRQAVNVHLLRHFLEGRDVLFGVKARVEPLPRQRRYSSARSLAS